MMKRFTIRLLVALITFIVGATAATLWAMSRQYAADKYQEVVNLDTERFETNADVRPQGYLQAIEIVNHSQEYPITGRRLEDLSADLISIDLDLGESIEDQTIILHTRPGESREFQIEQQFETSLTVMDEGPHIDLLDWKHYISEWKEIKRVKGNEFLTSTISETESAKFPKVTRKEIYAAVKERETILYSDYRETVATEADAVGMKWAEMARKCRSPQDYPCAVGVSKIRFRIKMKEDGQWKVIKQMEFIPAMGC